MFSTAITRRVFILIQMNNVQYQFYTVNGGGHCKYIQVNRHIGKINYRRSLSDQIRDQFGTKINKLLQILVLGCVKKNDYMIQMATDNLDLDLFQILSEISSEVKEISNFIFSFWSLLTKINNYTTQISYRLLSSRCRLDQFQILSGNSSEVKYKKKILTWYLGIQSLSQ